jgi:cyclopropane fatty-acyl-phospholipid synthase-like methyltransferase
MPKEWKGIFDVVVSIGVMEHGEQFNIYFTFSLQGFIFPIFLCLSSRFSLAFTCVLVLILLETVGVEYMREWFRKMSWAMKEEGSIKVFTMSTIPDSRWKQYT